MTQPDCGTLSAAELIGAVNGCGAGTVLTPAKLKQMRQSSGGRFNAHRVYSLPALAGWLHDRHVEKLAAGSEDKYETHKQRMAERSRLLSLANREIGEIPECTCPELVEACRYDLKLFCEKFLPGWFSKPFCEQQIELIAELQKIILDGGMQAIALPRHRGKTTITKAACLWAVLYGHRKYVVWLAAQDSMAESAVDGFWMMLRTYQPFLDAFPKACYPLMRGGGDQRSKPLYKGRPIEMGRRDLKIVFPDIEGSDSASTVLEAGGLLTAVRGLTYDRPDGTISRPDCVVLDDPQTDESALSDPQCDKREKLINGAVLGLSGPGVKMACIMPCTIIRHGDLSSRILDRKLNPSWHGIIGKMLKTEPTLKELWEKYNVERVKSINRDNTITSATAMYLADRANFDLGAEATWESDYVTGEASAIQHAMNIKFENPERFYAEYQNDPLMAFGDLDQLDRAKLLERHNLLPREIVPDDNHALTAFVDVHQEILYYMVVSWRTNFSGQIVSYGAWPDQKVAYFKQRNCSVKFNHVKGFRGKSFDTQLQLALTDLFGYLDQEWQLEGGEIGRLKFAMIDCNWQASTQAVDKFCAKSVWRGRVLPSRGQPSGNRGAIDDWPKRPKEIRGPMWIIPFDRKTMLCRQMLFDANFWKSRVADFLTSTPEGDAALVLHYPEQQYDHRLLVDHFCAEQRMLKPDKNQVEVWKLPMARPDNHWFDCVVGCAVAASFCGIKIPHLTPAKAVSTKKKKRRSNVHYGEWQ